MPEREDGDEDVTFGAVCQSCGAGTYSQHEDRLQMEIKRLQKLAEPKPAEGTHTEVAVAEEAPAVSDEAAS